MAAVQDLVSSLHNCLTENSSDKGKVISIINDVREVCINSVLSEKELALTTSQLFSPKDGLINFVRKSIDKQGFEDARKDALALFFSYIENYPPKSLPHVLDVRNLCMAIFVRDRAAKLQSSALVLLSKVFEIYKGKLDSDQLDISDVIQKLLIPVNRSATPPLVKQDILCTLGMIAECFPEVVIPRQQEFYNIFVTELHNQMRSKTRTLQRPVVSGCLQGLIGYLENFSKSAEEDEDESYKIFSYARDAISESACRQRNALEMPKAALNLFWRHGSQFGKFIYDDYENLYKQFSFWVNYSNNEVKNCAFRAMESFFKQIAEMLSKLPEERKSEGKRTFFFFVTEFRKLMKDHNKDRLLSLTVRGYGYFAPSCKKFVSNDDLKLMFGEMIQQCEQKFLSHIELLDGTVSILPSYLESLASMAMEIDEISYPWQKTLEKMSVVLIEHYPLLPDSMCYACSRSLAKCSLVLYPKGPVFNSYLSSVVFQGLIGTCSHPIVVEVELQKEEQQASAAGSSQITRQITYQNYTELWSQLLNLVNFKEFNQLGISFDDQRAVADAIYDEVVANIVAIIKKLDLSAKKVDTAGHQDTEESQPHSNPVEGLQANKPKDFQVFINLVDFAKDILLSKHITKFEKWICPFSEEIVQHSQKYPLVSGFYKLAAICYTICSKLKYFSKLTSAAPANTDSEQDSSMMDVSMDLGDVEVRRTCFKLLSFYAREVMVRLNQYKDDLMTSCLQAILSLPLEIVETEIEAFIPALQKTFTIGLSYFPLAKAGLEAIEKWCSSLPSHTVEKYYSRILPYLKPYLSSGGFKDDEKSADYIILPNNPKKKRGPEKIALRVLGSFKKKSQKEELESEWSRIQQRVLKFLGTLGGKNNLMLSLRNDQVAKAAVAWDTVCHERLRFSIPFMDLKPEIFLDDFLPHIVKIATTAGERQTKVVACELLHAVIVLMVGTMATDPQHATGKNSLSQLFKHIFPTALQLACDVDQVVVSLFKPLVCQMIHWFSKPGPNTYHETGMLLQCIWDGVTQSEDSGLRDFCSFCLTEFVKWSIKQLTPQQQAKNPANVKAVLQRLYSLSLHSNAFKRLGAALAFNSMYTVLREEQSVVDLFIIEILVNFLRSLALAHGDSEKLGTQEQCKNSIKHMERIVLAKSELLNKSNEKRRKPLDFPEATLGYLTRWLLTQCGSRQTEYRHTCMQLIFRFAPCLKNVKTTKDYFSQMLEKEGRDFFLTSFESNLQTDHKYIMSYVHHQRPLANLMHWMESLLAALDCYVWAFGEHLLDPSFLSSSTSQGSSSSSHSQQQHSYLYEGINMFIRKVAKEELDKALEAIGQMHQPVSEYTPNEINIYNRMRCTITVRMINFLKILFERSGSEIDQVMLSVLWNTHLWECIILCIMEPHVLGFDVTNAEVSKKLPAESLLEVFQTSLPEGTFNDFASHLIFYLSSSETINLDSIIKMDVFDKNVNLLWLKQVWSGYKLLARNEHCLQKVFSSHGGSSILQAACNICFTDEKMTGNLLMVRFESTAFQIACKMMETALKLGIEDSILASLLLDEQIVFANCEKTTRKGTTLLSIFKNQIAFYINEKPSFFSHLIEKITEKPLLVLEKLLKIFCCIADLRQKLPNHGKNAVKAVARDFKELRVLWSASVSSGENLKTVVSLMAKMLCIDSSIANLSSSDVFSAYMEILLHRNASLEIKAYTLDLLPYFVSVSPSHEEKIKSALREISVHHFPVTSKEFDKGTPQYNEYIQTLQCILHALEVTGNLSLYEFMIEIMCSEDLHVIEDQIKTSFINTIKRIQDSKHVDFAEVPYKLFLQEDKAVSFRMSVLQRVCLPILEETSLSAVKNFFLLHVCEMMDVLQAKMVKGPGSKLEMQLVSKMGMYQLLELLFKSFNADELASLDSAINRTFCKGQPQTGKELFKEIIRCAKATKMEDMRHQTALFDLQRKYHCAAYNALIAVVSCTQTEAKFYSAFLFSEQQGEYIWDFIIDPDKAYTFDIEVEASELRKKKFLTIRNQVKETFRSNPAMRAAVGSKSIRYMTSMNLVDSSLMTEISQFDFSTSEQLLAVAPVQMKETESIGQGESSNNIAMELDNDALNEHECMGPLVMLFQKMSQNGVLPQNEDAPKTCPKLLKCMIDKLEDGTVHPNVKLLIARVIINSAQFLKPYARFLLNPLMQLIISETLGSSMNYFILDIMEVLLSWASSAIPEDNIIGRHSASSILKFLMKNCAHPRRDVFRNNLEVIKTVVECWKTRVDIPMTIIYEYLVSEDPKQVIVGIHLLGVIVANNLPPYSSIPNIDQETFFKKLLKHLKNPKKEVYSSTAEVTGMVLYYLKEHDVARYEEVSEMARSHILPMLNHKNDCFINCIQRIHSYYTPFADKFLNNLLFLLPKVHGIFKNLILEVIGSRIAQIDGAFVELKSKGLFDMLLHRDSSIQLLTLKLLQGLHPRLTVDELWIAVPEITKLESCSDARCRDMMYRILMDVYNQLSGTEHPKKEAILAHAKTTLLKGLGDSDRALKQMVINFWSDPQRLPSDTGDRLVTLLSDFYSSENEPYFLQYSTYLLLEMTARSPDYNRKIFPLPLEDCPFQDQQILTSWRQRHAALTPLFAPSMSSVSTSLSSGTLMGDVPINEQNQVRATAASLEFAPTLDQSSASGQQQNRTYNWVTQRSLEPTFGSLDALVTSSRPTFHFTIGQADKNRSSENGAASGQNVLRFRRRFMKETEIIRAGIIKAEIRRKKARDELQKEQKARREGQVTMYRKYRIGDLPDIQIPYSAIIAPLQVLAENDVMIAKCLFVTLVNGIFNELRQIKPDKFSEIGERVGASLGEILKETTLYVPAVIGFAEELCYRNVGDITTDPESISTASRASNQQNLGILLLEKTLVQSLPAEATTSRSAKRQRLDVEEIPQEKNTWIKLAELYRSLEQYDVVRGIFSTLKDIKNETREALELEAHGDYAKALNVYIRLYNERDWSPDQQPGQEEVNLWDCSILECYNSLTCWDLLDKTVVSRIDDGSGDLQLVWENNFSQEHYLPYLLRSKLKRLISSEMTRRDDGGLLGFIDASFHSEHRQWSSILKSHYADVLALLYIYQDDYNQASYYSSLALEKFLQDWSATSILTPGIQQAKLQQLQPLIEMQEFLEFIHSVKTQHNAGWRNFLRKWEDRLPRLADSVHVWDDVVLGRSLFLEKIKEEMKQIASSDAEAGLAEEEFLKAVIKSKLAFVESANAQRNIPVAMKHIKWINEVVGGLQDNTLSIQCIQAYCHTLNLKSHREMPTTKLNILEKGIKQLNTHLSKICAKSHPSLAIRHYQLLSETAQLAASVFTQDDVSERTNGIEGVCQTLMEWSGATRFAELPGSLLEASYENIQKMVDIALSTSSDKNNHANSDQPLAQSYFTLANFCNKILQKQEAECDLHMMPKSIQAFPTTFANSLLCAMKHGSMQAVHLFPRVLQLFELHPDIIPKFKEQASTVPCWMFIEWIDHMMAILDKPEATAVHGIVMKITEEYPNALVYSFKLNSACYNFCNRAFDGENQAFVKRIHDMLSKLPLVDDFISALHDLHVPHHTFRDAWKKILDLMKKQPKDVNDKILKEYQSLLKQLHFDVDATKRQRSQALLQTVGKFHLECNQKCRKQFVEAFGEDGKKLLSFLKKKNGSQEFEVLSKRLEKELRDFQDRTSRLQLKNFSPWLANYSALSYDVPLEIPGQYTGRRKPMPEYHTTISGFDQEVIIFSSVARPRQITIRGNDERDYKFIVKAGEDLRQDSRIQHLFSVMNEIFLKDPACASHELQIATYKVIPFTTRMGLIKWIDNTKVLKDFIECMLSESESKQYKGKNSAPGEMFKAKMNSLVPKASNPIELYAKYVQKASAEQIASMYRDIVSRVPWDLLRRAFLRMSASPEAFLILRDHFATSHAILCIAHWILGIGDRHLSNFLVCLETGREIGIDFGHAFGTATQCLPIPELMPFRLTPQYLNLLLPLKEKGLFRATMVHALGALRQNHDILMSMMDVFIKAPLYDWEKQIPPQNLEDILPGDNSGVDCSWYPRQRIQFAQWKLEGANPSHITLKELTLGHKAANPAFPNYKQLCLGDKKRGNFRSRQESTSLTVEQQVDCLIDQATDPCVLGVVWEGWTSWV